MYKPNWNDALQAQRTLVTAAEKTWLKYKGNCSVKRSLKSKFCTERKDFDRLNRKFKRQYIKQKQLRIEEEFSHTNQCDFWKSIGKIGIATERKHCIPNINQQEFRGMICVVWILLCHKQCRALFFQFIIVNVVKIQRKQFFL